MAMPLKPAEMPLGQDGIRAIEKILAYPFQLHVPLGRTLSDDDKTIQLLTQQQFHILRSIESIQRVAVAGAAGTGKTVLAIEEARGCAGAGMRTLYTCYNRPLAGHVRARIRGIEGIDAFNFHELCVRFSGIAGIPVPHTVPDDLLFNKVYPEILVQALDLHPELRYDAIIIDEGQDFEPLWWSALDLALSPAGPGILRVFFDSNQRVYSAAGGLPADVKLTPIRLTRNLRNTHRIHDIVQRYYNGYAIEAIGPEGIATEWIKADEIVAIRGQLSNRVSALIRQEKVLPEDITVLIEHDGIKEMVAGNKSIGKYAHISCDKSRPGAIIVDTIRRFKGLESLVVVLIVTPSLIRNDELMYVATSRARAHLIMIGHLDDATG
jgi:superfamily I DNA and RNA helicase